MEWQQHGQYTLQWQGDILLAFYTGDWNHVCSQNLHRDARVLWAARGGAPWALLSDGSEWGSGTPESLDVWWQFFEDGVRHGMIAVSDILPSHFHTRMLSPLAERASRLVHYRRSSTRAEAADWLLGELAARAP